MVNAQTWLDKKYPDESSKQEVKELVISPYTVDGQHENAFKKELEGFLNIRKFVILKKLYLYSNKFTKLIVISCPEIELISCVGNFLTETDFLSALDPKKLTDLYLEDNNISERDLSCFEKFINLTALFIGNSDENKISQGIYNRFTGSLEFLKDLTSLKSLSIKNTDIDSGLEYLPSSIEEFHCLADQRAENRVKKIEEELRPFLISAFHGTYDFDYWKEKGKCKALVSLESEKVYESNRKSKAKRQISQREIKYQRSYLSEEEEQSQQIEINPLQKIN